MPSFLIPTDVGKPVIVLIQYKSTWENARRDLDVHLFPGWDKNIHLISFDHLDKNKPFIAQLKNKINTIFQSTAESIVLLRPTLDNGGSKGVIKGTESFVVLQNCEPLNYSSSSTLVERIRQHRARMEFTNLDTKIHNTIGKQPSTTIANWLNQWRDIDSEMLQIGIQILRNLIILNQQELLDRIASSWSRKDVVSEKKLPLIVFVEEDTNDSNTRLKTMFVNCFSDKFGSEFYFVWLGKTMHEFYSKPSHAREHAESIPPNLVSEVILVDECNISGFKAYGKDRKKTNQLKTLKTFADSISTSEYPLDYSLWFAYSTAKALDYRNNTTNFDSTFIDTKFLGVHAPQDDDFLRSVTSEPDQRTANKWKGGFLISIFFPVSVPANNYPALIHTANWFDVTGKSSKSRTHWIPLVERR
jgi:hypothetical protein